LWVAAYHTVVASAGSAWGSAWPIIARARPCNRATHHHGYRAATAPIVYRTATAIATVPVAAIVVVWVKRLVAVVVAIAGIIPKVRVVIRIIGKGTGKVRVVARAPERVIAKSRVPTAIQIGVVEAGCVPKRVGVKGAGQTIGHIGAKARKAIVA
jgi:hypothetical protein